MKLPVGTRIKVSYVDGACWSGWWVRTTMGGDFYHERNDEPALLHHMVERSTGSMLYAAHPGYRGDHHCIAEQILAHDLGLA